MEKYKNVGAGLHSMVVAQIGMIVSTVLVLIPFIRGIAGIASTVFLVINLVGLYNVGKEIEGCKKAFIVSIVSIVFSVLLVVFTVAAMFLPGVANIALVMSMLCEVIGFLLIYLVCTSVGTVLQAEGNADVAAKGNLVWKIELVCSVSSIAMTALKKIPGIATFTSVFTVIAAILGLAVSVLYLIFLYKSARAFGF